MNLNPPLNREQSSLEIYTSLVTSLTLIPSKDVQKISFSWDCWLAGCVDSSLDDAFSKFPDLRQIEFAVRRDFDSKFVEEKFWTSLCNARKKVSLTVL